MENSDNSAAAYWERNYRELEELVLPLVRTVEVYQYKLDGVRKLLKALKQPKPDLGGRPQLTEMLNDE
jgi:hypothetical protein